MSITPKLWSRPGWHILQSTMMMNASNNANANTTNATINTNTNTDTNNTNHTIHTNMLLLSLDGVQLRAQVVGQAGSEQPKTKLRLMTYHLALAYIK